MPDERLHRGLRVTLLGLATNVVLASIKFTAGIIGHSHALVADATESLADVFSSIVVWRGLRVAAIPADEDHPYGHGKAEPLAAAIVAAMLLGAALWIAIAAVGEILAPHKSPAPFTLAVLLLAVIVKEILFRHVLREGHELDNSAVRCDAWHHRADAITSVAAGIGISVALIGGPGYESADDWAAIAAACVIAFNGWRLLQPAVGELMDAAPSRKMVDQIRSVAAGIAGVEDVEKCFVRKMGGHYLVDMHIEVAPRMSVLRAHEIAHEVKDRIRSEVPVVRDVLVHIEPQGTAHSKTAN